MSDWGRAERYEVSAAGLKLIRDFEGFSPTVYEDAAGLRTIGYGHRCRKGELYEEGVTHDKALAMLRKDAEQCEAAIWREVQCALTQAQFDALVSFIFNVGAGAFRSSTLLKKLNLREYRQAADELLRWNKVRVNGELKLVQGLMNRRLAERALFMRGEAGKAEEG